MEFVDGAALDKFCAINRLLPMHRVIGIIFKCCLALDHAFRQGIVHRDIKPANILIDANDNPKITDFGLGLNLRKDMGQDSTFVMGVGSPAYMSPEQVKNYPLNHKTDLYSLGVLLFQLLTGRLPFRANNPATLVYKIVNMDSPSVCALNPNLPPGLDPIIKKALEKDLYSRYRNGAEFAKDLSAVRYQMQEEDQTQQDMTHFERLRKVAFFAEFEDIELWEVLRISVWRELSEKVTLIREGDHHRRFGIVVDGFVEVSASGRVICRLGSGEVVGEMAFLHPSDSCRQATVVTLEPTLFLDINSAALDLSSDEVRERFNKVLLVKVLNRLREANKALAKLGQAAVQGSATAAAPGSTSPLELL
jgi:CRP-like cAMP-binding protein